MKFPPLETLHLGDRTSVGGKAANLGELISIGVNVPKGFVMPVSISSPYISEGLSRIASANSSQEAIALGDRNSANDIASEPMDVVLEMGLLDAFDLLSVSSVSVRSSATIEDSDGHSFAGVFTTLLNVNRESLAQAVRACWASVLTTQVRDYCASIGQNVAQFGMAVIVQELVVPDVSGVCFTVNPITRNSEEMMIEAAFGFGDAIVSGRVTPDSYTYLPQSGCISSKHVDCQETQSVIQGNQLVDVPLADQLRLGPKLTDDQIRTLGNACYRIANHYGRPQDIEFAFRDNDLFFLQTRPITTLR